MLVLLFLVIYLVIKCVYFPTYVKIIYFFLYFMQSCITFACCVEVFSSVENSGVQPGVRVTPRVSKDMLELRKT